MFSTQIMHVKMNVGARKNGQLLCTGMYMFMEPNAAALG